MSDKLWAPWRMDYIQTPKQEGCVFCIKSELKNEKENLVLYRGQESYVLMNLYQSVSRKEGIDVSLSGRRLINKK